jgi:hypothetical protein
MRLTEQLALFRFSKKPANCEWSYSTNLPIRTLGRRILGSVRVLLGWLGSLRFRSGWLSVIGGFWRFSGSWLSVGLGHRTGVFSRRRRFRTGFTRTLIAMITPSLVSTIGIFALLLTATISPTAPSSARRFFD